MIGHISHFGGHPNDSYSSWEHIDVVHGIYTHFSPDRCLTHLSAVSVEDGDDPGLGAGDPVDDEAVLHGGPAAAHGKGGHALVHGAAVVVAAAVRGQAEERAVAQPRAQAAQLRVHSLAHGLMINTITVFSDL